LVVIEKAIGPDPVEIVIDSRADFAAAVVCTEARTTLPGSFAAGSVLGAAAGDELPPHAEAPAPNTTTSPSAIPAPRVRLPANVFMSPTLRTREPTS
jgi:hypothetical protein